MIWSIHGDIPSGNQTWLEHGPKKSVIFLLKPPLIGDFPLPYLMTPERRGCNLKISEQCLSWMISKWTGTNEEWRRHIVLTLVAISMEMIGHDDTTFTHTHMGSNGAFD